MRTLTIALVGAPDTGQSELLKAITGSLNLRDFPVSVVVADPVQSARCDLVLLMGLSGLQSPVIAASDQSIRQALAYTGIAFEVLYGTTQERLAQALHLAEKRLVKSPTVTMPSKVEVELQQRPWVWSCDKCSDPQCEHKLLTQLLTQRTTAP